MKYLAAFVLGYAAAYVVDYAVYLLQQMSDRSRG